MSSPGPSLRSTVLRLLLGRATFRLGLQATSAVLVLVWDPATFGRYASALGVCMSLSLVATAAEKTALKVLPRTRTLTPAVARVILRVATAPLLVLLAALAAVLVLAPSWAASVYVAAAAFAFSTGTLMTVSGLHRLRGRPMLDTLAFGAVGLVLPAAAAATWLAGWSPESYLALATAGVVAVTAGAVAALPRDWVRSPAVAGRPVVGRLLATMWLLGLPDVLDALGSSVVYLALAASGRTTESGPLFLVLLGVAAVSQVAVYLMRIAAPATSRRLRGTGGDAGRRRALGLMRRVERVGLALAVVVGAAVAVPSSRAVLVEGSLVVLVLLGGVEVVLYLTVSYGSYLLENTNGAILTVTSRASAAGLGAVALLAVVLVPPVGAVGALGALTLAVAVRAFVLRRMLLRARPELRAAPVLT